MDQLIGYRRGWERQGLLPHLRQLHGSGVWRLWAPSLDFDRRYPFEFDINYKG